ncbi:hypothetical protein P885DRAFT_79987, partial [Corynascus similis CBS 632.67]
MSGAARGASDVIDVMRGDSGSPGVGSRLPQRKRVKTTRAAEIAKEIAKEMAKMTAQFTEELSLAREQLTQARYELEDTRLQLQAIKEARDGPFVRPAYADIARHTPPASVPSLAPSASRTTTPEPAFCTVDMTR